jgi:hypothetical protein
MTTETPPDERAALRAALARCERAINESVSGLRKVGMMEWIEILAQAQAALEQGQSDATRA